MEIETFAADITAAKGFFAAGGTCGLKPSGRKDVGAVLSERPATAAGTFTTNKVKAAPVIVCQEVLAAIRDSGGHVRGIVFNSGNANAATSQEGLRNARLMQALFADGPGGTSGVEPGQVFVASTGVIGVQLPMDKLATGIQSLQLGPGGGPSAVEAMMTTDTVPKTAGARFRVQDATVTVAGMAKGAAMIAPHMATMLAFIGTDTAVEPAYLQRALLAAVEDSFNMIVIDGDMSTNDTTLLLANGAAWPDGRPPLDGTQLECRAFEEAVRSVCLRLAQAMARDGEGASKFLEVRVEGAMSDDDARRVARSIAGSNLTKAAVLGADPNWGRIACAAGYAGAELDPNKLEIAIGRVSLVRDGLALDYDAAAASDEMKGKDVRFFVHLHLGDSAATAWGCDLTPEYVRLNSEYTT